MKAISNVFKFLVGLIVLCCSACTGIEMGGKVGVYRVDERQESSRTNVENRVPLKCYFVDCYSQQTTEPK
jgi:hypothetical protein